MGVNKFFLFLSLLCFKNERIILKHNNGKLWIKCEIDKDRYLDGQVYVYDFCGELSYYGCYKDGYHIDSAMVYKNSELISKAYFKDSANFEEYIYNADTLYMKSKYIDGRKAYDINYKSDTTYIIKGGQILNYRHTLDDIMKRKVADCKGVK